MVMIIKMNRIIPFKIAKKLEVLLEAPVHEVAMLPASEFFPDSHSVHVPVDADGLWKPALHLLQDVSDAQVWQPAPQAVQEVASLLSALKVPAGQAVQVFAVSDGVW